MAFAMEAEIGAAFVNTRQSVPIATTLEEPGHDQNPIPIQLDNKSAVGIINDTMTQRQTKPMDMRFYWLKDKKTQKYSKISWKKGSTNKVDYPTKHHPTKHHQAVRPQYVLNIMAKLPIKRMHHTLSHNTKTYPTSFSKGVLKASRLSPYETKVTSHRMTSSHNI